MSYSRAVFEEAMQKLESRREKALAEAHALRQRMVLQYPRLLEIEQALADTGMKLSKAILAGGDIRETVRSIQTENEALQQEMAGILQKAGETAVNFEPKPVCALCHDTGYHHGKTCSCLIQLMKELSSRQICKGLTDTPARFEDLDLSFYDDTPTGHGLSPRERMRRVFDFCRQYAENFDLTVPSLLLRGPTGTGKTHLSLAIASAAAEAGYQVMYQPAGRLFSMLEKEHFGRESGNTEELAMTCDLLVLDDLGTEFETSFCTASLYSIINTRLLDRLPTVISTNLTQEGLQDRYGDQIVSRITGAFEPLLFVGKDIRQQKRERQMTEHR
ncbi:MAG: ATP-binding protein [Clostridia bacterium]|nr:ATP-binding protein [Clostridia bacterium]